MPVNFNPTLPFHKEIPSEVAGYELAPIANKGLWSIVSPTGVTTNLNTLGLKVLAYTGAGMPPVENITTQFGVLGGSYVQRTVVRPRTIMLSCIAEGETLEAVQIIKNRIIAQVAPYNSLASGKSLKLHFQLTNYCGDLIGTVLEVSVLYAGDLAGNTTNLYQDRFDLQFVEYNPPSIKELTTIQPSLAYITSRASVAGIRYRLATTGEWKFIAVTSPTSIMYDANGELWYGSKTQVTNRSGSTTQAVTYPATPALCYVFALAYDQNNNIYAAGRFTTPQNYIMKYNGSTWGAVGATVNGEVYDINFDNLGNLYAVGAFTAPGNNMGKWDGATWTALGTGTNGNVYHVVKGLDGNMYFAGGFTTANGVACNNIAMWNGTTFVPLGSGTNGNVYSMAVLPDGRIVIGGAFTTAGGISCKNVAVWNGTQWQPVGNGFNSNVTNVAVNPLTGDIYADGIFVASGTQLLPTGFARFNGALWLPVGATAITGGGASTSYISIRSSDGELAVGTEPAAANISNSTLNTLTYSGTADVFPQVKFTGPGTLISITNYATGKALYFNNYTLLAGETATFTHDPTAGISFVSSFFGNVIGRILPGSDVTTFSLVPGANYVAPYVTGGTGATKVELIYQNTHFSFEAGSL